MTRALCAALMVLGISMSVAVRGADWPVFMGSPARTGECRDERVRPPFRLLWRFRTDGSVRGSICVVDGLAYACSRDGSVYALDAKTGRRVWEKSLGPLERASAAVGSGKVFAVLNGNSKRRIFALDAKTGAEAWSATLSGSHFTRHGPLLLEDIVITIEADDAAKKGRLVCFDARTGEVRWRVTGNYTHLGDPSSDGATVFCGSSDGGAAKPSEIFAVDAKTGTVLWRSDGFYTGDIPTLGVGGVSVFGGRLYFWGRETGSPRSRLLGLDAKTGKKVWESDAAPGGGYPCVPTVTDKVVYVRNVAVDRATGKRIWNFPLKTTSCSPAVVANGYVFFGTSTGVRANHLARGPWVNPKEGLTAIPAAEGASKLYVLDAATGQLAGDFQVMNRVCSAVAIVDGILYFGSYDGCVYALVHDDKAEAVPPNALVEVKTELVSEVEADADAEKWYEKRAGSWPMFRHDSRHTGAAGAALNPKDLALLWSKDLGGKVRSSAAIADGRIYVGSDDGRLYCLEGRDGKELWKFNTGGPVRSSPAVWEDRVYVGSNDHRLYCLSARDGAALWSFETGDEVESSPCVFQGVVYFGSLDRRLYALDARSGAKKWVFTSFGCITASPAVTDETVSFGAWDSRIYCLSRKDGRPRWGRVIEDIKGNPQGGCIVSSPAVSGGTLVVTGDDPFNGVGAYNLATGEQLWWQRSSVAVRASPAVAGGMVFHGSERTFECHLLDGGKKLWHRWPILSFYSSPAVTESAVYVGCADGAVCALALDKDKLLWQFKTQGPVRSSPSVGEGLLVVGSDDGRIYVFGVPVQRDPGEARKP